MNYPSELSQTSKNVLTELGFDLTESSDNGMSKSYLLRNLAMDISFVYDRGYYECNVVPHKMPASPLGLIRLLRFLKNDKTLYKKELIKAKLWYTLPLDAYVDLIYKNYQMILGFVENFDQTQYDNYDNYSFSFDGI